MSSLDDGSDPNHMADDGGACGVYGENVGMGESPGYDMQNQISD